MAPVLEPPLRGSAPKTIKCLSVSEVITCKAFVGTLLAPEIPDNSTALVVRPSLSSHLNMPPALGFIIKSSPKLSCVQSLKLFVSLKAVAAPQAPAPHVPTPQPVLGTKTSRPELI